MNFDRIEGRESAFDTGRATGTGDDGVVDAGRRTVADVDAAPVTRVSADPGRRGCWCQRYHRHRNAGLPGW